MTNPGSISRTKNKHYAIASVLLVVIMVALYFYFRPPVKIEGVDDVVKLVRSFGLLAPVISFILLILQAFFPVIPFFLLASSGAILYGLWGGILLTWTGALFGASTSFFVARSLGRDWVLEKCEDTFCREINVLSGKKGFGLVLLARIIPVIPSTLVNLLAGVSTIRFFTFLAASALGKLPFIFLYSVAGRNIVAAAKYPKLFLLIGILALGLYIYFKVYKGKN